MNEICVTILMIHSLPIKKSLKTFDVGSSSTQLNMKYSENLWCEPEDVGNEARFPMMLQCFCLSACFLRGRLTAEKPKVDWGAGIHLWILKRREDESEMYVYVLPGHAWCMLMAHACVHRASVHDSVCPATSLLCMCQRRVCLFYFPCCLTCGWLIAFRVLTGPGVWLSSQPPWGMCLDCVCVWVCGCACACREGGRCLTPLISSTPACLFSQPKHNLSTDVMWHRAVSFI